MANRVTMTICGTEYILVAEEDAAYMEKIGSMVDEASRAKSEAAELRRKLQNAQNQNNRRG